MKKVQEGLLVIIIIYIGIFYQMTSVRVRIFLMSPGTERPGVKESSHICPSVRWLCSPVDGSVGMNADWDQKAFWIFIFNFRVPSSNSYFLHFFSLESLTVEQRIKQKQTSQKEIIAKKQPQQVDLESVRFEINSGIISLEENKCLFRQDSGEDIEICTWIFIENLLTIANIWK